MKTILSICSLIAVLSLVGCQSGPEDLAQKYMALACSLDKNHKALDIAQTEKEKANLQVKCDRIREQLDKVNAQILDKYQGDKKAMEIIREVTENYRCEEE